MLAHLAARPAWTCTGCGEPWPCPARRARLSTEYADSRLSLLVYLAGYLLDAAADLRHLPADELYARFLGWVIRGGI
ncbi:flavin reductase [Micromonospora echinofusca]|uniref:Flavin reductase n=1 Tax=Micromonospora echinofusca TaxID=47858 RepID=A0ABS3VJN3_MICEH|nr:flavin reductase [Micromonospora echinofusca]